MDAVFFYFVAIGSGITFGVALVALPIYWLLTRKRKRKER